jgi:hypothetical protein
MGEGEGSIFLFCFVCNNTSSVLFDSLHAWIVEAVCNNNKLSVKLMRIRCFRN